MLIGQVVVQRRLQPRLGTRKLLVLLEPFMEAHGIHIGRDVFFELLRVNGLLIRKRRQTRPKTTFSMHRFKKYPDLVKGITIQAPNCLWVSDITYIRLRQGFAYLSMVTDAYSRKIVGFCLSRDLSAEGCLYALKMALKQCKTGTGQLIHHSDRGTQYCCDEYIGLLAENHIGISMTQNGDPRDNAIAERVNGILKQELLGEVYENIQTAKQSVITAVTVYNSSRPHYSIDMLTPEQAHCRTGEIRRRWKSYYKSAAKEVVMDG